MTDQTETFEERRAREHEVKRAQSDILQTLTESLAKGLPGAWTIERVNLESYDFHRARTLVRETDAARLYLTVVEGRPGAKLHVSGNIPPALHQHRGHDDQPHGANIAVAKGPAGIAKEIVRRVLPSLDLLMERTLAQKGAHEAQASQAQAVADALVREAGGVLEHERHGDGTERTIRVMHSRAYGTFRTYGTDVRIDLFSVPVATALAIAKLIGETREGTEA